MSAGRPTTYNQEIAIKICEKIAEGMSLRSVCRLEGMPHLSTVFAWIRDHKEFSDQYAKATTIRTDAQHEDLMELGDEAISLAQSVDFKASNAVVSAVKLKADNLKWSMARMQPKKYGEKMDVAHSGEINVFFDPSLKQDE
mgnify:CR=1 FL=1